MKLNSAVNRISWRFQDCKIITVNNQDIDAVNRILDFINKSNNNSFNDNIHFAKLYAFCLDHFIERYNTTISDSIPHKLLHELLDKPFEHIILEITSKLNLRNMYKILQASGSNLELHPSLISNNERKKNLARLEKQLLLGNNKKLFLENTWSPEQIEEGIIKQIKNYTNEL